MLSLYIIILLLCIHSSLQNNVIMFGPGLQPYNIVMPARYFFINFTTVDEYSTKKLGLTFGEHLCTKTITGDQLNISPNNFDETWYRGIRRRKIDLARSRSPYFNPSRAGLPRYNPKLANNLAVEIKGLNSKNSHCRVWANKLDRKDGTFIVRYKVYETCFDVSINVYYKSKHIHGSPLTFTDPVQPDQCNCPEADIQKWLNNYGCPAYYKSILQNLKSFQKVDMRSQIKKIVKSFHNPESTSFCHYAVKDNQIYRDCYGKHVGFNMFADNILLFLSRIVILPDMELVINLGDWPLVKKSKDMPVFSWCGSNETMDIIMPTYDLTEATLENMGRVTLDTLSVQGSIDRQWNEREPIAIWRGRDSRAERLHLIDIARANPDLFNASLTNFFFFRDKEAEYGPKQPHISFFKFFDYKYQINIDGTVAAYRLPYLLAGGGMVLKQDSPYYEHFYSELKPWKHYVPVARDLSDLKEKALWAREHDDLARNIAKEARKFANGHLLPQNVICYHAVLFLEWSKRITSEVKVENDMTHVPQPAFTCDCKGKKPKGLVREEL